MNTSVRSAVIFFGFRNRRMTRGVVAQRYPVGRLRKFVTTYRMNFVISIVLSIRIYIIRLHNDVVLMMPQM